MEAGKGNDSVAKNIDSRIGGAFWRQEFRLVEMKPDRAFNIIFSVLSHFVIKQMIAVKLFLVQLFIESRTKGSKPWIKPAPLELWLAKIGYELVEETRDKDRDINYKHLEKISLYLY